MKTVHTVSLVNEDNDQRYEVDLHFSGAEDERYLTYAKVLRGPRDLVTAVALGAQVEPVRFDIPGEVIEAICVAAERFGVEHLLTNGLLVLAPGEEER